MAEVTEIEVSELPGLGREFSMRRGPLRCAIYTRKSTDEGLEQKLNSLEVQREAAESYVASQEHEGWVALPDRYDDGGYSGATAKRPALQRLLSDIERGGIDCVVVYKVDRLSRSLVDFARILEVFNTYGVSFVSVTQDFNTTNPLRKLMLNVLLSFAQFEREVASDRMRDKIGAIRRKGKWYGGQPILGYDAVPEEHRLVVNDEEAERVRAIFELYLEHRRASAVVEELRRRGWCNKRHVSKKGRERGGRPFTTMTLCALLRRVVYTGKMEYKGVIYPGEHEAIVDEEIWRRARDLLREKPRTGTKPGRNKYGALLKGVLYCDACDAPMGHRACGGKRGWHRCYYVCVDGRGRVRPECPTRSVPAEEVDAKVVEQLRGHVARSREVARNVQRVREQSAERVAELIHRRDDLNEQLKTLNGEMLRLVGLVAQRQSDGAETAAESADLEEQVLATEQRMRSIRAELVSLHRMAIDAKSTARAFVLFDERWDSLSAHQRGDVIRLLVERVSYDGRTGRTSVRFRALGNRILRARAADRHDEPA